MSRLVIAFDVDDTLIVPAVATGFDRDVPNYDTIAVYRWFQAQGHTMIIWSGGGDDYARQWADKLGLVADYYADKHDAGVLSVVPLVDIAFDDSDIALGQVNVKVKRLNNKVVRYRGNYQITISMYERFRERLIAHGLSWDDATDECVEIAADTLLEDIRATTDLVYGQFVRLFRVPQSAPPSPSSPIREGTNANLSSTDRDGHAAS